MKWDEAARGNLNLIEFTREDARWQSPHEIVERDGVLLFAGSSDFMAFCNGMRRVDDDVPGADAVAMAQEFFAARGRGFSVWSRVLPVDDDLRDAPEAAGLLTFGEPAPQMICRARIGAPALPLGVTVARVESAEDVGHFARVNGEAYTVYGAPADATASHFDGPMALRAPHVHAFLARLEGEPVGALLLHLSHGIAGVYWVAVLEPARGRGIAAALMGHVTNLGFDLGATNVQLQASTMGEPIYRRLGYDVLYRARLHLAMPPS
ncbi:MAG: GNAT family N-acetyltransferase [Acidimicrobiia bacterium]